MSLLDLNLPSVCGPERRCYLRWRRRRHRLLGEAGPLPARLVPPPFGGAVDLGLLVDSVFDEG